MSAPASSLRSPFLSLFDTEKVSAVREIEADYYCTLLKDETWNELPAGETRDLIEQMHAGAPWRQVIQKHFTSRGKEWTERIISSPARSLLLELFDLEPCTLVADLGSGWGQLTRSLARRVPDVISVEPDQEQIEVSRAIAAQEKLQNILFLKSEIANLPLVKNRVDLALLCGALEWVPSASTLEPWQAQRQALAGVKDLLSPRGQVVVAIENRAGLKYLLGERDDHTGLRHVSNLPGAEAQALHRAETGEDLRVRTYDLMEYRKLFEAAGLSLTKTFLAFPDYKLPEVLIPAEDPALIQGVLDNLLLPKEHDGVDGSLSPFAEIISRGYRVLSNSGVVPLLAPSFILVGERLQ